MPIIHVQGSDGEVVVVSRVPAVGEKIRMHGQVRRVVDVEHTTIDACNFADRSEALVQGILNRLAEDPGRKAELKDLLLQAAREPAPCIAATVTVVDD